MKTLFVKANSTLKLFSLFALTMLSLSSANAAAALGNDIDIPYEKFVLDNGLTVIVHEDHKAPIVAVNVWYHVGSKNEKPGKTGFAHLFEHLMFNGSENFNDDYFQAMERVGATDMNGTTNEDRTNYFQNVPTSALDVALWMESDRMGHLIGAVDQERLDEQRGVVQNEKRQGENQPYGLAYNIITENTYPGGHPYSWTVIGSMDDLNAASLEDVQEWFKTYYGAANAVVTIAGDIQTEQARAMVEKYFGDIPSGPPIEKQETWIAKRTGEHRVILEDRVPQARIYKVWNVPPYKSEDIHYLDLLSDVLAYGKNSRLYTRLVYEDQIATSVGAFIDPKEIGGQFMIQVTARPGQDLAEVENAIDEELQKLLEDGPTADELLRAKTQHVASFIRGIERIGGFGGKSDILAMNEIYAGDPEYYKTKLNTIQNATRKNLKDTANRWLSDGVFVLEVHPFPEYSTTKSEVDRSELPDAGTPPDAKFPDFTRDRLSNGLELVLAERHSVPLIEFSLIVNAGFSSDQLSKPGTASLAMNMLDEGTRSRTALEISEELALLGASVGTGSDLDVSVVSLSALKANLDESLDIFADVILNPSFPQQDFARIQKQQLDAIDREKSQPVSMALRLLPSYLYGESHAYGMPYSGSGNSEAVNQMTREDTEEFHATWFKPNNASLVIVGDTTMAEIKPKLERLFRNWEQGNVPAKNISEVAHRDEPVIYLMDRPGAIQSLVMASHIARPKANPDEIAIQTMNTILGGAFTSRINMNLREDKHWSYGARSLLLDAKGQRAFISYAQVQTDKTAESMAEILKELKNIRTTQPITSEELNKAKQQQTLELSGTWETLNAVGGSLTEIVEYGLPDAYYETYSSSVRELTTDDVSKAADEVIHPENLVWIVVGDRAVVEQGIRDIGFGELHIIDPEGKNVE